MPGNITINAHTQTPANLFSGPRCYITPEFQRPYVWEANQVDQLWKDIEDLTKGQESHHFTGVILLQNAHHSGHIEILKVIDGQQRLTTLQLLLSALRTVYQAESSNYAADSLYNLYLANRDGVPPDQPELGFKINHSNQDDAKEFRSQISASNTPTDHPDPKTPPSLLPNPNSLPDQTSTTITAAYQRLLNKVENYSAAHNLDDLQQAILNNITMAVIQADADDPSVYAMFTRLNSTGTLLSTPDLVRAATFQKIAELPSPSDQAKAKDLWDYSDPYWKQQQGIGIHGRSNLGHVLHHWLCAEAGKFIPDHRDNNAIVRQYEAIPADEIIHRLTTLKVNADLYRRIQTNQLPEHSKFTRDFNAAGYNAAYGLALFCLTQLDQEAQGPALDHLGSYLMRLALAGIHTSGFNKTVPQVISKINIQLAKERLDYPKAHQADIVKNQLLGIKHPLSWPEDSAVMNQLTQDTITETRTYAVIKAIAEYMEGPNSDTTIHNETTVEHIMPRSWQRNWPLPQRDNAEQERATAIRMLGNLTILHGRTNTQANNGDWEQKRRSFTQSNLKINEPLAKMSQWDEAAIRSRTEELAKIACQIWPKPEQTRHLI